MKFKIRIKNGKPVDFQTYTEKEEYTPKFIEIEPLPQKEGFYIETYLDETEVTVKQRYVEIPKTEEELTLNALKEQARKGLDDTQMTKDEVKKNLYLFEKYQQDKGYSKGDLVQHLDKLYRCRKKHTSSYDTLPQLDSGHWEEVNGKGETIEPSVEIPFYSDDLTYNKGDLVMYYGKVYESLERQSGKNPESSPKTWKKR